MLSNGSHVTNVCLLQYYLLSVIGLWYLYLHLPVQLVHISAYQQPSLCKFNFRTRVGVLDTTLCDRSMTLSEYVFCEMFSLGHHCLFCVYCIVSTFAMYIFWIPLWYFQTIFYIIIYSFFFFLTFKTSFAWIIQWKFWVHVKNNVFKRAFPSMSAFVWHGYDTHM